jgi:hypothetical protein
MSKLIHINNEYAEWVKSLSLRFRQSQVKAAAKGAENIVTLGNGLSYLR